MQHGIGSEKALRVVCTQRDWRGEGRQRKESKKKKEEE